MTVASPSASSAEYLRNSVEAVIRIAVLLLLAVWCFQIVRPFVAPVIWGIIIAIAMFPIYQRCVTWFGGRAGLTATLLALLMLLVLAWPSVLLTQVVVDNAQAMSDLVQQGELSVPPPPPGVAEWPIIGETVSQTWTLASTNLEEAIARFMPQIQAFASWLLSFVAGLGLGLLQFIFSIIIAGILMAHSAGGAQFSQDLGRRLAGDRGAEFVDLAGATVRGVARGVIGVAFIQSLLVGAGMVVADIPGAGLWTGLALVLAIIQLGVAPVMIGAIIYMFSTADMLPAVMFLIYGVVVSAMDNVLKPILMGRGLDIPMVIILIGTIGGMLSAGIVGLFIGAVVLAVGYKLFTTWLYAPPLGDAEAGSPE